MTEITVKQSSIGRIVKSIALIEAIISTIIAAVLAFRIGDKYEICDSVKNLDSMWLSCLRNADTTISTMWWMAGAWLIGGIMAASVIYCIGHVACQIEENNRLLHELKKAAPL